MPEIDGLRFIAIASVLLYHIEMMCIITSPTPLALKPAIDMVFGHGGRGVLLFFCISGFILGMPFARRSFAEGSVVDLRKYFTRRVTRLEPPYILNLLIRLPFVAIAKHISLGSALPHLLASIFYVHTLVYGAWPLIHGPSWSLEVEVQFYVLAPLIAPLLFRPRVEARRFGTLTLIFAATALQLYYGFAEGAEGATRVSFSILNFGQFFLVGLFAADCYFTADQRQTSERFLDFAGPVALVGFFFTPEPASRILLPLFGLVILWAALRSRAFKRVLSTPTIYLIGGMCYSIYLTHSFVLQSVFAVMGKFHLIKSVSLTYVFGCLFALPVVLFVGSCFFLAIERPCMDKNWPRKLWARLFSR